MNEICASCEYVKYCARSKFETIGCSRYKEDTTTNEQWIRRASTEELAKWIHDVQFSCNTCTLKSFRWYKSHPEQCPLNVSCAKENGVLEWLKEKHTQ